MIVSDYFHGDSIRIGMIQHDCYGEALRIIVDFASAKHREAEAVVNVRTELSDLRDELNSFDHRTLQWLHDCMTVWQQRFVWNIVLMQIYLLIVRQIHTRLHRRCHFGLSF